jgi:peptide/nickel transport system substrate-binding protein
MSARALVVIAAVTGIALVLVQDLAPHWAGFHTWQYAAMLAMCGGVLVWYIVTLRSRRAAEGEGRLLLAIFGALIVLVAGLASGLLGPDTETLARAPGTVLPIADVGAAAFYPNADAAAIARGDTHLILRRRNGGSLDIAPGERRFMGTTALEIVPRPAAFIEVRDPRGNHLTLTQPTNPAFLSPVLLFPQTVAAQSLRLSGSDYPVDAFAVPAVHRSAKAIYFSKEATNQVQRPGIPGHEALLVAVDDDGGKLLSHGVGFALDGKEVQIGEIRLKVTLGTYPALVVSAAPSVAALWIGGALFLFGLLYAFVPLGRRPVLAPAALMVLGLLLPSCTRVGGGGTTGAGLHPWTKPDTVRIGLFQEPDSLNPVISSMAFASDVFQLVFDGLIRYDDTGHAIPDLAREVPSTANGGISKDGRTFTYHLMPNAKWHDGVPVTADDVIFTYQQIMNPANLTPTRNGYDKITKIEAPDPHTLVVHFKSPYPPALYLFRALNQGAIIPKHLLAGHPDINRLGFNSHPVGSGPYIFKGWRHGSEMWFDANPNYFRGKPKIAHAVLKFVPDQNTLMTQLQSHEVDLYYNIGVLQYDQVRQIDGIKLTQSPTLHWEHINFNTQRPPLDDVRVRRALCSAVDEETIYQKIYHGLGTKGPVHFNPAFEWGDKSIAYYSFDLDAAGAMLDAAGWKQAADGKRYKNGAPLTVTISTVAGVKQREAIEVLLQSWWRKIGVDVSLKNFPAATLFAPKGAGGMLYGGKTDVAIFTWLNATPDPDDTTYINPNRLPPIGQNVSFYQNPDIGRWEDEGLATFDPAKRRDAYLKIQRVLIDQVPEYVLNWQAQIDASNVDLNGVRPVPVGSDLWNIAEWTYGSTGH